MLKIKPIKEGRECRHTTCGSTCHREPAVAKIRKPISRSSTIKKTVAKNSLKNDFDVSQDDWFLSRAKEMSGICCNCGGFSSARSGIYWKWSICHIFPKDKKYGFPSVATHPLNWIELCIQCHTLFDRSLSVASTLKCWDIAVEKFKNFEEEIKEKDRKYYSLFKELSNGQG